MKNKIATLVPIRDRMDIENFIDGPGEEEFVQIFEAEGLLFEDQDQEDVPNDTNEPYSGDTETSLPSSR